MEFSDALRLIGIEKECVIRNSVGICNRNCGECDLAQEDTDLIETFQMAEFALRQIIHEEPKMTNADKIRQKSDEELAEWIERIRMLCANDACGKACPLVDICYSKAETPTETLDWLRQEATE